MRVGFVFFSSFVCALRGLLYTPCMLVGFPQGALFYFISAFAYQKKKMGLSILYLPKQQLQQLQNSHTKMVLLMSLSKLKKDHSHLRINTSNRLKSISKLHI